MSLEYLKKIAIRVGIIGGVGTFVMINTIPYIISENVRKTEEYKEAMRLLRAHPEAIRCLGEPIKEGRVNPTSRECYGSDDEKMWFKIPVYGSKTSGSLYYDHYIDNLNDGIPELRRVELMLKNIKDYKLLIKKPPEN